MEYVITHPAMGRKRRHPSVRVVALDQFPSVAEGPVGEYTVQASPDFNGLVEVYRASGRQGPLGAKASYLLRDTLKVVGAPEANLPPSTAGVFYVNDNDPLAGGTGHTIRVCMELGLPVVFQAVWLKWLKMAEYGTAGTGC